jgi:hypothetical protein
MFIEQIESYHLILTITTAPADPGKCGLTSMHAWHSVIKRPDKQQKLSDSARDKHTVIIRTTSDFHSAHISCL